MGTEPEESGVSGGAVGLARDETAKPDRSAAEDVATGEPGSAEPAGEVDPAPTDEAANARRPMLLAAVVLASVAVICALVFGTLWVVAANDNNLTMSRDRDTVLQAAEQGAINLTTMDYRNVQQGLDRWKESATGDLYSQLTQGQLVNTFVSKVQQAKVISAANVREGSLTELDDHAGKASAIIVLNVTVTPSQGQASTKEVPVQAQLTRTDSGWKLSSFGQVSTGNNGQ